MDIIKVEARPVNGPALFDFSLQDIQETSLPDWPPVEIRDHPMLLFHQRGAMPEVQKHLTFIKTTKMWSPYPIRSFSLNEASQDGMIVRVAYFLFPSLKPVEQADAVAQVIFRIKLGAAPGDFEECWIDALRENELSDVNRNQIREAEKELKQNQNRTPENNEAQSFTDADIFMAIFSTLEYVKKEKNIESLPVSWFVESLAKNGAMVEPERIKRIAIENSGLIELSGETIGLTQFVIEAASKPAKQCNNLPTNSSSSPVADNGFFKWNVTQSKQALLIFGLPLACALVVFLLSKLISPAAIGPVQWIIIAFWYFITGYFFSKWTTGSFFTLLVLTLIIPPAALVYFLYYVLRKTR